MHAPSAVEKGKTHTILSYVSVMGFMVPAMIYPRKICAVDDRQLALATVPDKPKERVFSNILFKNSESGWINSVFFVEWFSFFLKIIPPVDPILLYRTR